MVVPRNTILQASLVFAVVTAGFAASLALTSASLGVASTNTPRCTTAGLGVIQNVSAATVISVTVSGLPSTCGSATLQVTVNNLVTSSNGSATVPGGGGSVTVTLAAAVAVTAVEEIDIVLTGP